MRSILKSVDSAVAIGLGTAAGVVGLYSTSLPSLADIRVNDPHNSDIESTRKGAAIKSALLIGTVFLITKDKNVLTIAGSVMVALDYAVKHSNGVDPATGRLDASTGGGTIAPDMAAPLPDYSQAS